MTDRPPDGLAALTAQRERARRSMPAPRHPVANGASAKTQSVAQPASDSVPGNPALPSPGTTELENRASGSDAPGPSAKLGELDAATFKVTLYLDHRTDDFMEASRVEGLTSRPKVDVSRSAVVRLALRRLMEEMTPAEVKSLLQAQPVRTGGPGRKRR